MVFICLLDGFILTAIYYWLFSFLSVSQCWHSASCIIHTSHWNLYSLPSHNNNKKEGRHYVVCLVHLLAAWTVFLAVVLLIEFWSHWIWDRKWHLSCNDKDFTFFILLTCLLSVAWLLFIKTVFSDIIFYFTYTAPVHLKLLFNLLLRAFCSTRRTWTMT